MTELQGAGGLAQVEKVRSVVERRVELGRRLTDQISAAAGITTVPLPKDREVSWWNYIFHVTGHQPEVFCQAVRAEGVSVSPHYIKDPIFLRGEFLTKGQTYGNSGFPFNSPYVSKDYHYGPDLVPKAVQGLGTVAVMGIHEQMNEGDIDDMATAINKVANALSK